MVSLSVEHSGTGVPENAISPASDIDKNEFHFILKRSAEFRRNIAVRNQQIHISPISKMHNCIGRKLCVIGQHYNFIGIFYYILFELSIRKNFGTGTSMGLKPLVPRNAISMRIELNSLFAQKPLVD